MEVIKIRSRVKDLLRLIRCVSFSRLVNLLQLQFTWWIARYLRIFIIARGPAAISIEATTFCNLQCPECLSGMRKFTRLTGSVNMQDFTRWVNELRKSTIWLNLYFQGEPFLHKELVDMIRFAEKNRFYIMISTNGHYLTEENCNAIIDAGLDRLVVSLDGLDQESYEKYRRGGDLNSVTEGIETLCRIKNERNSSHPYLIIQCLLLSNNSHQAESFRQMKTRKGIDEVQFKTAQFYDFKSGNSLMPMEEKHSRYLRKGDSGYVIRSNFPNYCRRLWFGSVITWNGHVLPCCYDKDGEFRLGDLSEENFLSIWKGGKYRLFRQKVFNNRKGIDICTNCGEGLSKCYYECG